MPPSRPLPDPDHLNKKPERKKFYEAVNERLHAVVTELTEKFPELQGAVVALSYAPEIGDPPSCLVLGDLNDPQLLCRLGLQAAKLQTMVSQGISQHIARAMDAHARLTQEADAKQEDPSSS